MTKSELFKAAHKLAKSFVGDYRARFVMALSIVRNTPARIAFISDEANELNKKFNPGKYSISSMNKVIDSCIECAEGDADEVIYEMSVSFEVKAKATFFNIENKIVALGKTFAIKENLKEMGFSWNGRVWSKVA